MKKIIIPEGFFQEKWGRVIFPWSIRKDKTKSAPFADTDAKYELTINKKVKTLNFGDDFFSCGGIQTELELNVPNANLINIDIKSTTNHAYNFNGYDYIKAKKLKINGKEIIFKMWPDGKEGQGSFGKYNYTSSNLENLELTTIGCKVSLGGQHKLEEIKITSPNKKLSTLNLTIEDCPNLKLVDLSQIEEIQIRGIESWSKVDSNIVYKFNPNLQLGLSTLHIWANWDKYSPFKYSPDHLIEEFKSWDDAGKIITLKDICPDIEKNSTLTLQELSQKINEFLINKAYSKPYAFKIQQEYEKDKNYKVVLTQNNYLEYKQWLKQEEERKAKEERELEEKRKIWAEQDKKRKEELARQEAESKRLAKIAYDKKVKEFKEKIKSYTAIQQAYLETLLEQNYFSFKHKLAHQSPFDYTNNPKLLKEIDSIDKITKMFDKAIEEERLSWCGPHDDGDSGCAEAMGKAYAQEMIEKINKKVKDIELSIKTR